jgi:mRNA interferase HicA
VKREKLMGLIVAAARTNCVTFELVRQGNHEVWRCGGKLFPVPRHREINEHTARGIMRSLEPWLGEGWWRS